MTSDQHLYLGIPSAVRQALDVAVRPNFSGGCYGMRTIFAIIAVLAVLTLGGISGAGFQAGHSYNADQIAADGENGGGG